MTPNYQILFVRPDGQIMSAAILPCANDAEAAARIVELKEGLNAELWRDGVCVGKFSIASNDDDGDGSPWHAAPASSDG